MRIDMETWKDVVRDIEDFIPRLIQACDSVSELLYEPMTPEGWGIFAQVLEGYENLYKSIHMTVEDAKNHDVEFYERLSVYVVRFPDQILALQKELNVGNHVAVGDQIKYEWTKLLADVLMELKEQKGS